MTEKKKPAKPAKLTDGNPKQFRLMDDTLAEMDVVASYYGLKSRSDAIRFLFRKEAREIKRKEGSE